VMAAPAPVIADDQAVAAPMATADPATVKPKTKIKAVKASAEEVAEDIPF
jgi:hypothetical protein